MTGTLAAVFNRMITRELAERIIFFPMDERLVPIDDEASNVGGYLRALPTCFHAQFIKLKEFDDGIISKYPFVYYKHFKNTLKMPNFG